MGRVFLAVAACACALAPGAQAATLDSGRYTAAPGEANRLTLSHSDGFLQFNDPGATIAITGGECELTDASGHAARCRNFDQPIVDLGDADDTLTASVMAVRMRSIIGGPGADQLTVHGGGFVHGDRESWGEAFPDDGADSITVDTGPVPRVYETLIDTGARAAIVYGTGGDDRISITAYATDVYAGAGDDVVTGDDAHPPVWDPRDECPLEDKSRCTPPPPGTQCLLRYSVNDTIHGGPGDDRIAARSGNDRLFGEDGSDTIDAGADCDHVAGDHATYDRSNLRMVTDDAKGGGNDTLSGGELHDELHGGPGDDALSGGSGDDELQGAAGADAYLGGAGDDWTSYLDHAGPVRVTLDEQADDGEAGEGDLVAPDVENVTGTQAPDRLVGNSATNGLGGMAGDDVIVGGGGPHDSLSGGGGSDTIRAREGEGPTDRPWIPGVTYSFDDVVYCDSAWVPPPADAPYPGTPNPGPPGTDLVFADPADLFHFDSGCESIVYADEPVVVDPNTTETVAAPAYCDPGLPRSVCRATATLRTKDGRRLGSRAYSARRGAKRARVRIPVSRSAARRARGGKRVKAWVAYRHRRK